MLPQHWRAGSTPKEACLQQSCQSAIFGWQQVTRCLCARHPPLGVCITSGCLALDAAAQRADSRQGQQADGGGGRHLQPRTRGRLPQHHGCAARVCAATAGWGRLTLPTLQLAAWCTHARVSTAHVATRQRQHGRRPPQASASGAGASATLPPAIDLHQDPPCRVPHPRCPLPCPAGIGPEAVCNAIMAVCHARLYLEQDHLDIRCIPSFQVGGRGRGMPCGAPSRGSSTAQ